MYNCYNNFQLFPETVVNEMQEYSFCFSNSFSSCVCFYYYYFTHACNKTFFCFTLNTFACKISKRSREVGGRESCYTSQQFFFNLNFNKNRDIKSFGFIFLMLNQIQVAKITHAAKLDITFALFSAKHGLYLFKIARTFHNVFEYSLEYS